MPVGFDCKNKSCRKRRQTRKMRFCIKNVQERIRGEKQGLSGIIKKYFSGLRFLSTSVTFFRKSSLFYIFVEIKNSNETA